MVTESEILPVILLTVKEFDIGSTNNHLIAIFLHSH